jgi:hypothetical protein
VTVVALGVVTELASAKESALLETLNRKRVVIAVPGQELALAVVPGEAGAAAQEKVARQEPLRLKTVEIAI